MATTDPVQGLIDYVNEIKPFHSKILEVIVAYAQNDDVSTTITEDFALDVTLFYPAVADENDVPIRDCPEGYGILWDRQSPYIVVDAAISPQTISLDGDHTGVFDVGTKFEIREPYADHYAVFGSPITDSTPRIAQMLATSVVYNEDSDTTVLGVVQTSIDFIGSPVVGSPAIPVIQSFDPLLFDSPIEGGNHTNDTQADLWFTGEEYFGENATADYVFAPTPFSSFDRTTAVRYPVVTHSQGSPGTTISDGKYYVEIEVLDLETPSNAGWGPLFGLSRAENNRRDSRSSSVSQEETVWIDGFNTGSSSRILQGDGTYDTGSPLPRITEGDVVRIAVDYENEKVWFGINDKWVGSGTQNPSTNDGGYWPTDWTTTSSASLTPRPRFTLTHWPFNQTGGGSPHLPGSRTNLEDVTAWRFSEQFWEYSAPTGFQTWPDLLAEPNTVGPGEYEWLYPSEPYNYDSGSSNGHRAFANTFNQRPVITFVSGTNAITAYYSLSRGFAEGGKFYAEGINLTNGGGSFGIVDQTNIFSSLGSPTVAVGSPFAETISSQSQSVVLSSGGRYTRNGAILPLSHPLRNVGLWTGGPSDDGRSSESADSGDTYMLAFDFDRNLMHVGVNGVWLQGIDPATGLSGGSPEGGVEIAVGGSPLNHSYLFGLTKNGFGAIANLGGVQFEYAPPAGYEPWAVAAENLNPTEFYIPPYQPGSRSNGDVFIIYDVVKTNVLNIITRPNQYYGSPAWGSPFGSPRPGSPLFDLTGSPGTFPNFGSPMIVGNTITIKATSTAEFIYGKEVQLRNAVEPTLNRDYNIYSALDLGGSPHLVELTVLDPVLANTIDDGELVLAPIGWSGGSYCSDVPPELAQLHWIETYQPTWRFAGSPDVGLQPAFQHFILAADSSDNTIQVQGDVRYLLTDFVGSPLGSPFGITASIQHSINPGSSIFDLWGSPFGSPLPGSPKFHLLNNNNGPVVILDITYDVTTNRSTIFLDTITDDYPTGWIVSVPAQQDGDGGDGGDGGEGGATILLEDHTIDVVSGVFPIAYVMLDTDPGTGRGVLKLIGGDAIGQFASQILIDGVEYSGAQEDIGSDLQAAGVDQGSAGGIIVEDDDEWSDQDVSATNYLGMLTPVSGDNPDAVVSDIILESVALPAIWGASGFSGVWDVQIIHPDTDEVVETGRITISAQFS